MRTTTTRATTTAEEATTSRKLSPRPGRLGREAAGAYVGDLFAEHGRMVLGLCRLLLRDPVEAEDAAQQVFLSAHQAILRGSPPRDQAAWMAAIARNECRGRIRARMREPLALPELPSDLPDPLAAAIRAADLKAVWLALGELPRRQRNALVLRELGGLSYHELGRALGVSHSAVESLLFRARRQIRSLIAGANAVAAPMAVRDQLSQLIPGFDPSSAAVVARVAAVPLALKVAGAAVGLSIVAGGVGETHRASAPPRQKHIPQAHRVVHVSVPTVEHVIRAFPVARVSSPSPQRREASDRERAEPEQQHEADQQAHAIREPAASTGDSSGGGEAEPTQPDVEGGSGSGDSSGQGGDSGD